MKNILQYVIWTGIYAVLIVPFIVINSTFFPFIVGKAFTFRIIVELLLGLWLILIIKDKEFRPKFSWLLACAGLFTLVLLVADILAVAPYKAFWSNFERMEGWVTIIHLLAYFLVVGSMLKTEKLWQWFLRTIIASPFIYVVYEYFAFLIDKSNHVIAATEGYREYINMTGDRFSGPLGNPIYIAVYFLFLFFFILILWYKDALVKKEVFKNVLFYVYPLIGLLSFYIVYRTSRGALLGLIGGLQFGFISGIIGWL